MESEGKHALTRYFSAGQRGVQLRSSWRNEESRLKWWLESSTAEDRIERLQSSTSGCKDNDGK